MGVLKEIQSFFHNLTTEDHYASYDDFIGESKAAEAPNGPNQFSQSRISMINNRSSASLQSQPRQSTGSAPGTSSSNGPVQYNPGMRSQQTMNKDGIQMQEYVDGHSALPPIQEIWEKIDKWLDREFPELGDDMENGATVSDLNAFEKDLGVSLPLDFRESYKIHDGQVSLGKTRGLIFSYPLMDLESIAGETAVWRKVYDRIQGKSFSDDVDKKGQLKQQKGFYSKFVSNQRSLPEGAIQPLYCHPNWIPFVKDNAGNNIALDLAAGPKGHWGQVILFGRDYDTKVVVASSFSEFLFNLSEDLEDGKFEIDEDENLLYYDHNTEFEFFNVLKLRAFSKYNVNPARKQRPRKKQLPMRTGFSKQAASRNASTNSQNPISLPQETLISPKVEVSKAEEEKQKKSKVTNDSFVIDDEEGESKKEIVSAEPETAVPKETESKDEEVVDNTAKKVSEMKLEDSKEKDDDNKPASKVVADNAVDSVAAETGDGEKEAEDEKNVAEINTEKKDVNEADTEKQEVDEAKTEKKEEEIPSEN
ncbi:DEBR0S2_17788g1_1 [Brettanomyces bruxellensis]|uniref:DEBR0S2_17788g1_1 n=1 Tax=Dekkera bruxellensis TaxID=5007 RepID=A0A7D9CXW0_DEKBR|nr:DEBR0S2_17788g1_1 [Brettanomyces bruxellensis]